MAPYVRTKGLASCWTRSESGQDQSVMAVGSSSGRKQEEEGRDPPLRRQGLATPYVLDMLHGSGGTLWMNLARFDAVCDVEQQVSTQQR